MTFKYHTKSLIKEKTGKLNFIERQENEDNLYEELLKLNHWKTTHFTNGQRSGELTRYTDDKQAYEKMLNSVHH